MPRLLMWCQHALGMGHLVRSYALAAGLAERFDVVLVAGGHVPDGIAPPPGVRIVPLPAVAAEAGDWSAVGTDRGLMEARTTALLAAFDEHRPDVLVVELFPFGRKRFTGELVSLLMRAHALDRRPQVACSVRDILVGARRDQARHDRRARFLADRWFDLVLVHGDPSFASFEDTFPEPLTIPVHHTGFVVAPGPAAVARPAGRLVVASAGGGAVGEPLLTSAIQAQALLAGEGYTLRAIAGPLLPADGCARLADLAEATPGAELVRVVPDLPGELREAAVSVSQCGYNTALEVVGAGIPAIVVPYASGREDEQRRRADRLAALGAVSVLSADDLTPGVLADAVRARCGRPVAAVPLALDGAARSAELLEAAIGVPA
jgi:predicted glycosyltransferase